MAIAECPVIYIGRGMESFISSMWCPCREKSKRWKGYGPLPCVELSCAIKHRLNMSSACGGHVIWSNWSFSSATGVGLTFFQEKMKSIILSVPWRQVRRFEQGVPGMASSKGLNLLTLILQPIFITKDLVRGFCLGESLPLQGYFFLNGDNKVFLRCSSSHIFITSFWKIVRFLY